MNRKWIAAMLIAATMPAPALATNHTRAYVAPAAGPEDATACSDVSLSTSSAQSSAIAEDFVDVTCEADCRIAIGSNPTATATGYFQSATYTYRHPITRGNKVAGLVASGTSTMHACPAK